MTKEGYRGILRAEWFRAFFESTARNGIGGAIVWILTSRIDREYGVTFTTTRDAAEFAEITQGAQLFASMANVQPPSALLDARRHLIPRQFAFSEADSDPQLQPQAIFQPGLALYRYLPMMAVRGRFEKLGGGNGCCAGP